MVYMTTNVERTASPAQVAEFLGLSTATIARYARESRIPFVMTPGKHRRFNLDEVRDALDGSFRFSLTPIIIGAGSTHIGAGPSLATTPDHAREQRLRAVETVPAPQRVLGTFSLVGRTTSNAIEEFVSSARRILVAVEQ